MGEIQHTEHTKEEVAEQHEAHEQYIEGHPPVERSNWQPWEKAGEEQEASPKETPTEKEGKK